MLHEPLRDDQSGPHPAGAQNGSHAGPEHPHDGGPQPAHDGGPQSAHDGGPWSAHDQHRREVLLRVVRISDALNQRLAL